MPDALVVVQLLSAVAGSGSVHKRHESEKLEEAYLTLPTSSLLAAKKSFSVTITAMSSSVAR